MPRNSWLTLVLIVSTNTMSATPPLVDIPLTTPDYHFALTVQLGPQMWTSRQSVPAGEKRTVDVVPEIQLTIETPNDEGSPTVVTLIDKTSGSPIVAHTTRQGGPASFERQNAYVQCAGGFTFISPAPPKTSPDRYQCT
jgi:hypothetical protein